MSVKILDCTLRDGGYVNNWAFGEKCARKVVDGLAASGVDYIEIGFLRNTKDETETTVFTSLKDAEKILPETPYDSKIFLMIVYGKFDIEKIPPKSQTKIDGIRVTFKKHEIDEALEYIRQIKEKGYIVSANPTAVNSYTDRELLSVIEKVNAVSPQIFAFVDTLGMLKRNDVIRFCYIINHNLLPQILLAFHSHNNLQLSFSNAQAILDEKLNRDIIIDVSVMGMGRGSGNLNAELMISYLNENYGMNYNLLPILKIIDEHISKIYMQTPWGYSLPYFLAAIAECHPNYTSYLINKQTLSIEAINHILSQIPHDRRSAYNEELIGKLYYEYQEEDVDDTEVIKQLKDEIKDRTILIIAPGKTIETHREAIRTFIQQKNPFIFSLNFRPKDFKADKIFISNAKRYGEQTDLSDTIVTSNIRADLPKLNYMSYLNDSALSDNTALIFLKVLEKLGVKTVFAAGLDGFKSSDNFADTQMINNARASEFEKHNRLMREMIKRFETHIKLTFITPSLYEEGLTKTGNVA